MWILTPQLWEDLLNDHGLTIDAIDTICPPKSSTNLASCRLIHAHRPR